MNKQIIGLIGVLIIVIIIFSSVIIYNQWPLLTGNKIILSTQPVDPFDPFMGQYMTINYEISRLNNAIGFEEGDNIYVTLEEDEQGIYHAKDTFKTKPNSDIFIKGKVIGGSDRSVRVKYGIEQYFFERNADLPTTNITVQVSVSNSGRAKIVQLFHNGKILEIKYEKFDIKS